VGEWMHWKMRPLSANKEPMGGMGMLRFDHVGIVVDDLDAVAAFFFALGFEREGGGLVEGEVVDKITGLDGVRAELVMVRTPDRSGKLEHMAQLLDRVAAVAKAVAGRLREDSVQRSRERRVQGLTGCRLHAPKRLLDDADRHLNGIEVRRVAGEEEDSCPGSRDRLSHAGLLVDRQVIQDDKLPRLQRRNQDVRDVLVKGQPINRAID